MDIKELKSYILENKRVENYFYTGVGERTLEKKFEYIKNHFTYNIMNSWNCLESIANKVKIYDLGLNNKQINKFWEILEVDNDYIYNDLNFIIKEFKNFTNTDIFFNGRSDGYLVIKPSFETYKRHQNILDIFFSDNIYEYTTFKEFKKDSIDSDYCNYENEYMNNKLENCYYLLKAFDKLCDCLREELIYILDNAEIEEETVVEEKIYKYINM